ncbi:MAG: hypothetical protein AAFV19_11270 [Pseudomonadota bacterium]
MRAFLPAILAAALMTPTAASAQSTPEIRLPEKLDRILRDTMEALEPAIDDALDTMREFQVIDDPRNYEMPEVLPNGDIIIRRRPDAPGPAPEENAPDAKPDPVPEDDSVKT